MAFAAHKAFLSLALLFLCTSVLAYVPAQPTNSTKVAIEGGLNVTDISKLHLRWFSNGSYSQNISYQLAGYGSSGISKGALVHFSEEKANNQTPPTTTPWIAMVSCDFNATDASQEEDVFTLARDKGAVAALLYSLYSYACVINPEYTDPETFDQVFDIFSTQSLTSAHLIEYQFGQLGPTNESIYGVYDSKRLNDSASVINATVETGAPVSPGYLFAILQAYNATGDLDDPIGNGTGTNVANSSNGNSPNTALAMIILYAITGCVSALFCVVIVSGAIRAIRNPERYGPRARNGGNGAGQSRARGLTRAILDTFPVVKFGDNASPTETNDTPTRPAATKDVESQSEGHSSGSAMELHDWEVVDKGGDRASQHHPHPPTTGDEGHAENGPEEDVPVTVEQRHKDRHLSGSQSTHGLHISAEPAAYSSDLGEGTSHNPPPAHRDRDDVVPAAIGRETCPICIMDFEEGDDLRLLPCEGKHRFHQSCVDPWLLELSSSCPICRQDFLALENILSGESEFSHEQHNEYETGFDQRRPHSGSPLAAGNRFSRYLRFAKRRHRDGRGEDEPDPTDPYMPPVPDSPVHFPRPSPS